MRAREAYNRGNLRLTWEQLPYGAERLSFVCDGPIKEGLLRAAIDRYGTLDGYTQGIVDAVNEGHPFEEFVPQGDEGVELAEDLKALNHAEASYIVHVWAVAPERQRLERMAEALLDQARDL